MPVPAPDPLVCLPWRDLCFGLLAVELRRGRDGKRAEEAIDRVLVDFFAPDHDHCYDASDLADVRRALLNLLWKIDGAVPGPARPAEPTKMDQPAAVALMAERERAVAILREHAVDLQRCAWRFTAQANDLIQKRRLGLPYPTRPKNAPPDSKEPRIKQYRLGAKLGEGGQATVYAALDPLGVEHAIKIAHEHLKADPAFLRDFFATAQLAATVLAHPHIVPVEDYGWNERDCPYLVMPRLHWKTFEQILETRPSPRFVCVVVDGVLQALGHAHDKGVIHRDISDSNIFVGDSGFALLSDFGTAKAKWALTVTPPSVFKGKLPYAAPERLRGKPADERSDLYSLGVVAYQGFTGKDPFEKDLFPASVPPARALNPALSPALDRWLARMMAADPGARFDGAARARAELLLCPEAPRLTIPIETSDLIEVRPAPRRRRWRAIALGGAVASIGAVGAALLFGHARHAIAPIVTPAPPPVAPAPIAVAKPRPPEPAIAKQAPAPPPPPEPPRHHRRKVVKAPSRFPREDDPRWADVRVLLAKMEQVQNFHSPGQISALGKMARDVIARSSTDSPPPRGLTCRLLATLDEVGTNRAAYLRANHPELAPALDELQPADLAEKLTQRLPGQRCTNQVAERGGAGDG